MSKKSKLKKKNKNQEAVLNILLLQKALQSVSKQNSDVQEAKTQQKSTQDDVLLTLIKSYFDFNTKSVEKGLGLLSELIGFAKVAIDIGIQSDLQTNANNQKTEQLRVEKDFEKEMTKIKNTFELEKMKLQNANIIPKEDFDKVHSTYTHKCGQAEDATESKVENIYEGEKGCNPSTLFKDVPNTSTDAFMGDFLKTQKLDTSTKDPLSKIRKYSKKNKS